MLVYLGTENRILNICPSTSFVARKYTTVIWLLSSTSTSEQSKSLIRDVLIAFVIDIFYVHDNDDDDDYGTGLVGKRIVIQ
jgi:hypothetical protein